MKNEWTEKIEKLERENKETGEALKELIDKYWQSGHESDDEDQAIIKIRAILAKFGQDNKEMLEALKDVFAYLDTPHRSSYGNVEIIDRVYKVLVKVEAQ